MLTFLAPATSCNQRCSNCYITEVAGEPVRAFELAPADYTQFVQDFLDVGVPILSIKFQGYEVTLPQSWPYLEAVFDLARREGIRRSFITNGMLLHKWTDRVTALGVARIAVSLDGSSGAVNDRYRGLPGAFDATTSSVRRFLKDAPDFAPKLGVASLLRADRESFGSLMRMPVVLRRLGLFHWVLSAELGLVDGAVRHMIPSEEVLEKCEQLAELARREGIHVHLSDEYGALPRDTSHLKIYGVSTPQFFYRLDPTGSVLVGRGVFQRWNAESFPRWSPRGASAPEVVGYWQAAAS